MGFRNRVPIIKSFVGLFALLNKKQILLKKVEKTEYI
jgi:hypothetical protein